MDAYIGYTVPVTGEVAGSTTAAQLPSAARLPCKRVTIRARTDNAGNVYIGFTSGVSLPNGSSDQTTGLELAGGDAVTFSLPHTNMIYFICDNAGDDFTYLIET